MLKITCFPTAISAADSWAAPRSPPTARALTLLIAQPSTCTSFSDSTCNSALSFLRIAKGCPFFPSNLYGINDTPPSSSRES